MAVVIYPILGVVTNFTRMQLPAHLTKLHMANCHVLNNTDCSWVTSLLELESQTAIFSVFICMVSVLATSLASMLQAMSHIRG